MSKKRPLLEAVWSGVLIIFCFREGGINFEKVAMNFTSFFHCDLIQMEDGTLLLMNSLLIPGRGSHKVIGLWLGPFDFLPIDVAWSIVLGVLIDLVCKVCKN